MSYYLDSGFRRNDGHHNEVMIKKEFILLVLFLLHLPACSPYRFFTYPNQNLYIDPEKLGMPYDVVTYPSLNGKNLSAITFKTNQIPKGTVVHFHGNFGNVSNHFLQSQFLVNHGFDVLVFDYQGFGASQGSAHPKNAIEDGQASVRWAQNHLRNVEGGVFLFGQSFGAAVGTVVAAKEPCVNAVVLEGGFNSYRSIARDVTKRSVFTWILYPIYPLFLSHAYDPERFIGQIAPRPVLILHGDADKIVPSWMSDILFKKAGEPKTKKVFHGADHLELRKVGGKEYENLIADFFTKALTTP